jgi:hypothetical protein
MTRMDVVGRSQDLVFAEVDGEAVALSAALGTCYGLDGIGLRVLQLIDPPATVGEICRQLEAEYAVDAVTCETDTINLLKELEIEGLIVVGQESPTR